MSGSRLLADTAGIVLSRPAIRRNLNINGVGQMVTVGSGWLVSIVVIDDAAVATSIYDAGVLADRTAATLMFVIPASAPIGTVYNVNMPYYAGIAITPGAGTITALAYT
jgi:hypothetical protein